MTVESVAPNTEAEAPELANRSGEKREARIRFARDLGFHADLRQRVDAYFSQNGISPTGGIRMAIKTVVILLWFAASWGFLVFAATTWWHGLLGALSLAGAAAGIGFAIQHDANHGAYSRNRRLNRALAASLDMMGGSSYIWSFKHNQIHHTYTNIEGADTDFDMGFMGRLAPTQRRYWFHRFQHVYAWLLYGFVGLKWQLVDDFSNLASGKIGSNRIPRGNWKTWLGIAAGKVVFLTWAFVIPMMFHPPLVVLGIYAFFIFAMGMILSTVFQLAHCVEEAEFPIADSSTGELQESWAVNQVNTTVDFAAGNWFLTWYLGGLNFQAVHHLFPRVCHIHYPALAPILEQTCKDHGLQYRYHRYFFPALRSHWRWLKRMGQPVPAA